MFDPDAPTIVEYTDGSTADLPSVTEYRRIGAELDRQYEELKAHPLMQAILNFDLSQP